MDTDAHMSFTIFKRMIRKCIAEDRCLPLGTRDGVIQRLRQIAHPYPIEVFCLDALQESVVTNTRMWHIDVATALWGQQWVDSQRPAKVPLLDRSDTLDAVLKRGNLPSCVVTIVAAYDNGGFLGAQYIHRMRGEADLRWVHQTAHRLETSLAEQHATTSTAHRSLCRVPPVVRYLVRWKATMEVYGYEALFWFEGTHLHMELTLPDTPMELVHK